MATESQQQQQPRMLHFLVSTNKTEFPYQVRYPASMAFVEFKIKLELVVGIYAQDMRLELRSPEGKFMAELFGDDKTLEELGIADNSLVHVHDVTGKSPAIGQLPSESSTAADDQHYVMPDEKYDSRKESVRKWKQELLASQKTLPPAGDQKAMPDSLQVGKSCVVHVSGQPRRFAQIAYVGPTQFGTRPGQDCWVGVVYEEAVGKNDGSLEGKRYFTCEPGHGGFVRPSTVEVIEEDGHLPAQLEQAKAAPMEEI